MKEKTDNLFKKVKAMGKRLVVAFILVFVVMLTTALSFVHTIKNVEKGCIDSLRDAALTAENQISILINSYYSLAENFSNMLINHYEMGDEEIVKTIQGMRVGTLQSPIRLYLPNGYTITENEVYSDASGIIQYQDIYSDTEYISVVKNDQFDSSRQVIELFYPVKKNGEVVAMMSISIDLAKLSYVLLFEEYDGQSDIVVYDKRDNNIMRISPDDKNVAIDVFDINNNQKEMADLIGCVKNGEEAYAQFTSQNGATKVVFFVPSQVEGLAIGVEVDSKLAFSYINIIRVIHVIVILVEFIGFLLYFLWIIYDSNKELKKQLENQRILNEQRMKEADNRLIASLSDDFECLYFIDPYTGVFEASLREDNDVVNRLVKKLQERGNMYENYEIAYEVIHPDDVDLVFKTFSKNNLIFIFENDDKQVVDSRWGFADNDEFIWIRSKIVSYTNVDGSPRVVIGVEDVTEEKEKEIREKKTLQNELNIEKEHVNLFHTLIHSGKWSINFTAEKEVESVVWSDELRRILGFDDENDFPNTFEAWYDRVFPDDKKRLYSDVYNAVMNMQDYETEYRAFTKQGEIRWYAVACSSIIKKDGSGELFGTFIDVTESRTMRQMQSVIAGLSEDFSLVLYINPLTLEENIYREDRMYSNMIPNWDYMSNYTQRIDAICDNLVHPEDRDRFYIATRIERVKKELKRNSTYYINYRHFIGSVVQYRQVKFALAEDNSNHIIAGFKSIDKEMRQQLDNQEALEQALNMAKNANEAKTTFLSNVSHDIRTPMNAIIGYSNLALTHINEIDKVEDYIGKIGQSSEHLLDLINDVLDMSRIESGKMSITEEKQNIYDLIRSITNMVDANLKSKEIAFGVIWEDVKCENVYCDKLRLSQVLINILSNSIKYTDMGGRIKLSIREDESSDLGCGSYSFTIEDNGIGMSEEFLEKIFDPFIRVDSTTVSGIEGTGLGMSITKNIVELMGGEINVYSQEGVGTKVCVSFEFKHAKDSDEKISNNEEYNLEGKTILLVDDNDLNNEIASEMLKDCGVNVIRAFDGADALEIINKKEFDHIDLILMDIQMPIMDGYEATKRIRALDEREIANIPIIAMTANAFHEDRIKSLEVGMNEHMAKPFDINKLKETINRYLFNG